MGDTLDTKAPTCKVVTSTSATCPKSSRLRNCRHQNYTVVAEVSDEGSGLADIRTRNGNWVIPEIITSTLPGAKITVYGSVSCCEDSQIFVIDKGGLFDVCNIYVNFSSRLVLPYLALIFISFIAFMDLIV